MTSKWIYKLSFSFALVAAALVSTPRPAQAITCESICVMAWNYCNAHHTAIPPATCDSNLTRCYAGCY